MVEAKKAGSTLTGVKWQSTKYTTGLPDNVPAPPSRSPSPTSPRGSRPGSPTPSIPTRRAGRCSRLYGSVPGRSRPWCCESRPRPDWDRDRHSMVEATEASTSFVSIELDAARAGASAALFADYANVGVLHGDWRELREHGPFDLLVLDGGGKGKEPADDPPLDPADGWLAVGGMIVLDDFTPGDQPGASHMTRLAATGPSLMWSGAPCRRHRRRRVEIGCRCPSRPAWMDRQKDPRQRSIVRSHTAPRAHHGGDRAGAQVRRPGGVVRA